MILNLLKISLTIFLFGFSYLNAEIVNNLIINGNKRVSNETIKVYGEIELNKNYLESDLNKILYNLYSTEFFEDVKLNLANNTLTIDLKEYPVINQLIFNGENNRRYVSEIKKLIKLKEKKSFIKSYLSEDIGTIKKLYSSVGYNFSEVTIKVKNYDDNKID